VLVTGAVAFEARVRYEDGLDVEDYLTRAGGVRDDGNEGKVSVRYQNGEIRSARRVLGVRQMPRVEPGSTIIVPERTTPRGFNLDQTVARAVTLLSGLATIILTVRALD
jgi:polysaccharide export outer membrane protein